MTNHYIYTREAHFRILLKYYQGIENDNIPEDIIDKVFELVGPQPNKSDIRQALKTIKATKYNVNCAKILEIITGNKYRIDPDDITKLVERYNALSEQDKKKWYTYDLVDSMVNSLT